MMASVTSASHCMQRRDSPVRSSSTMRPRFLRATATEPSITTFNASPDALATQPGRRASELLSRVAFVSGSSPDPILRSPSLSSTRSSVYDGGDRHSELSSSPDSNSGAFDDLHSHTFSGRYFSFPSFDLYETSQQEDEKLQSKSP
ncbi:hypothetical protein VTH06DRAFT_6328 [Thermothelomyces fergusii]